MIRSFLNDFGSVKENKTFTLIQTEKKIACVSKKSILLQDYKPEYQGFSHKMFTDDEVKRRHLGKIRCVVKFKTDEELKEILTKYFNDNSQSK